VEQKFIFLLKFLKLNRKSCFAFFVLKLEVVDIVRRVYFYIFYTLLKKYLTSVSFIEENLVVKSYNQMTFYFVFRP